jgi:7-cyano-7-deazaguanine synthase
MEAGRQAERPLPNTFVPGRNLVFLTYAAAFAWQRKARHLVTGVAQADYSGYPDCRQETITALQLAIRLGMERNFEIHTPLMNLSKKQTVDMARALGALEALGMSHTCYRGMRPPCGTCPACVLRAKGFSESGIADPLLVA